MTVQSSTSSTQARAHLAQLRQTLSEFVPLEVAGSLVLLAATLIALFWANSPWAATYERLWHLDIGLHIGEFHFDQSLLHWVNDGLMALFFFVVGLEIKRELLVGELSSLRKALLPMMGALGGMVMPALLYAALNRSGPYLHGWGIPMATDIAFAVGVLALLGSRVPPSLKIFLTALAIVDDIGAILVIAFFYTSQIFWGWLGLAALLLVVLVGFNLARIQSPLPYAFIGAVIWFAVLVSGIHATVAGVLIALTIPAKAKLEPLAFVQWGRKLLDTIETLEVPGAHVLESDDQQVVARSLQRSAQEIQAPLQRLNYALHPLTTFGIIPLFALANAGVTLPPENVFVLLWQPVSLGVVVGLVLGKQLGITLFAWLAVKLGWADLPEAVSWPQLYGVSWLGGIGFTMSLFISGLAFREPEPLAHAKLAILIASLVAGVVGFLFIYLVNRPVTSTSPSPSPRGG